MEPPPANPPLSLHRLPRRTRRSSPPSRRPTLCRHNAQFGCSRTRGRSRNQRRIRTRRLRLEISTGASRVPPQSSISSVVRGVSTLGGAFKAVALPPAGRFDPNRPLENVVNLALHHQSRVSSTKPSRASTAGAASSDRNLAVSSMAKKNKKNGSGVKTDTAKANHANAHISAPT